MRFPQRLRMQKRKDAEKEAKQDQPESFSGEWVPQQEAKTASC